MVISTKQKRLLDPYRFVGFRSLEQLPGVFGDPKARIIELVRRSKKQPMAPVVECIWVGTTTRLGACAIFPAGVSEFIWRSRFGEYFCRTCAAVKRERISFPADGALHTKRFAY